MPYESGSEFNEIIDDSIERVGIDHVSNAIYTVIDLLSSPRLGFVKVFLFIFQKKRREQPDLTKENPPNQRDQPGAPST